MRRMILLTLFVLVMTRPAHAAEVRDVVSPRGLHVWFIEDHRIPVVSLDFAFRGGMSLDPANKPGLAHFVSGILDEGAGSRDSEAFQTALADNNIDLSFDAGRDSFDGQIRFLTAKTAMAGELLHDSLTSPHIAPADVDRIRDELIADLKRRMADPEWVAQRAFNNTVFHDHPYGQPGFGSLDSLAAIMPDDLRGYIKAHFGRDQLLITATGDMSAADLGVFVDRVFDGLPDKSEKFSIPDAIPHSPGQLFVVEKPIPESVLLIGGPGPKRDDPDWYAAEIMNYALGGGGFNSRLMEEVRAKRALTYGIGSSLIPYRHAGLLFISGSTKNEDAAQALNVVKAEITRMQTGGLTDVEIGDAKTYLTGSLALQMTSTAKVSLILLSMRLDDLPIDFLDKRAALFEHVTAQDVARVARQYLDVGKLTTIVLGKPDKLASTAKLP